MSAHDEVVDTQFETIFQNKHPQDRIVQSVAYKRKEQNKKVMAKKTWLRTSKDHTTPWKVAWELFHVRDLFGKI